MNGLPDALPTWTATIAQAMLAAEGTAFERHGERLVHVAGFVAVIDGDCTVAAPALVLLGALAAFGSLARVPGRRLVPGALFGIVLLALANELRLAVLLWAGVHTPLHFGWLHEIVGPLWLVAVGAGVVLVSVRGGAPGPALPRHAGGA